MSSLLLPSLPAPPPPAELNRLLVTFLDYGLPEGLAPSTVLSLMGANTFGGRFGSDEETLRFALAVGFLKQEFGRVRPSDTGLHFLELNKDYTYELAPGQSAYIAATCVFAGAYEPTATALFRRFALDLKEYSLKAILPLQPSASSLEVCFFSFLRALGIVVIQNGLAVIDRPFHHRVLQLRSKRTISLEDFDLMLLAQKERGKQAEEQALAYERARLRAASCAVESERVTLVSRLDVTAGYDIASYDGPSPTLEFDRFIEVKSTIQDEHVFVWSAHERATAAELGPRYWIYLAISFDIARNDHQWLLIQDPESECGPGGRIRLKALNFRAVVGDASARHTGGMLLAPGPDA